jgi:hypothetical protein
MDEDEPHERYASAIMEAIKQVSGGTIERRQLLQTLMTVSAMVVISGDDHWTDAGAFMLGDAYGKGMTKTLVAMLSLRANGGVLPFDNLDFIG